MKSQDKSPNQELDQSPTYPTTAVEVVENLDAVVRQRIHPQWWSPWMGLAVRASAAIVATLAVLAAAVAFQLEPDKQPDVEETTKLKAEIDSLNARIQELEAQKPNAVVINDTVSETVERLKGQREEWEKAILGQLAKTFKESIPIPVTPPKLPELDKLEAIIASHEYFKKMGDQPSEFEKSLTASVREEIQRGNREWEENTYAKSIRPMLEKYEAINILARSATFGHLTEDVLLIVPNTSELPAIDYFAAVENVIRDYPYDTPSGNVRTAVAVATEAHLDMIKSFSDLPSQNTFAAPPVLTQPFGEQPGKINAASAADSNRKFRCVLIVNGGTDAPELDNPNWRGIQTDVLMIDLNTTSKDQPVGSPSWSETVKRLRLWDEFCRRHKGELVWFPVSRQVASDVQPNSEVPPETKNSKAPKEAERSPLISENDLEGLEHRLFRLMLPSGFPEKPKKTLNPEKETRHDVR